MIQYRFFLGGGTSTMDITGISKSKAGLGLQFEVLPKTDSKSARDFS